MLGLNGFHQLEVGGGQLEVGREFVIRPAAAVGFLEVLGIVAGLAAPELLWDRAKGHVVDLGHADQATEDPVVVVNLDDVADFPSSVVVPTIG